MTTPQAGPAGDPTLPAPLSPGWTAALSEAWEAYCAGSYAIGACVTDASGAVIARGRNRLSEPRGVEGGVIRGHDLAHAEINALLNLTGAPRPDCHAWTVLTTVQPCPQCAGAIAMSGLRAVAYAAPDPWAGCTHLLTDDPYVSRKGIRVLRAPADVQRAALRLALVSFLEDGHDHQGTLLRSFHEHQREVDVACALHAAGTLAALRRHRASLTEVLRVLT
ncbi:nucleoside deaminase [Deinococcus taeanensis]|uniref:nucleoside deaminase n=1 Tax=Deinococcus taeanensis TaxID=2737050 RepID=UPI001CDC2A00|nr:nucleoside deaminase [Deinococcus taeanensis]UBV42338.1 nucleoside deaminase [Deinococcus taeanensis]